MILYLPLPKGKQLFNSDLGISIHKIKSNLWQIAKYQWIFKLYKGFRIMVLVLILI